MKELLHKVAKMENGEQPKHVTFVAGSHQDAPDHAATFMAGADDFIVLPCDPSVLQSRISMHLKNVTDPDSVTGSSQVALWEIGRLYQTGPVTEPMLSSMSAMKSSLEENAHDPHSFNASQMRHAHRHLVMRSCAGEPDGGSWAAEMQVFLALPLTHTLLLFERLSSCCACTAF